MVNKIETIMNTADPTETSDNSPFLEVTTGDYHSCGIKESNGQVLCWGKDDAGQLGDGSSGGGDKSLNPTATSNSAPFSRITGVGVYTAAAGRTCGIRTNDSRAMCWGNNWYGQIGDSTTTNPRNNPTDVNTSADFFPGWPSNYEILIGAIGSSFTSKTEEWILSCMATDGFGNSSWTNSSTTTIVEGNAPGLTLNTNTSTVEYNGGSIHINWTVTDDTAVDTIWFNITNPDGSEYVNRTTNPWSINLTSTTNLTVNETYTIRLWANDSYNNINSTSTTFVHNDTTNPSVTWETPTPEDDSSQEKPYAYLNTTITDNSIISASLDMNGTLVGYWNFEYSNSTGVYGNATWADFATFENGVDQTNLTTSKFGNAVYLDGSTYLSVPDASNLDGDGAWTEITLETWVYPTASGNNGIILAKRGNAEAEKSYQIGFDSAGTNQVFCGMYTSTSTYEETSYADAPTLSTNTWHHVACTYTAGDAIKLYINGSFVAENTDGTLAVRSSPGEELKIGARDNSGAEREWEGGIDEVKIHNRTLSWAEINASYAAGTYSLYNNFTGHTNGTYTFSAFVIDAVGHFIIDSRTFTILGDPPLVSDVVISPINPTLYSDDLLCNATLLDNDTETLSVYYEWHNISIDGTPEVSGVTGSIANNTNSLIATLGSDNTTPNETWYCQARAWDGVYNSSWVSDSVLINSPPTSVNLSTPSNGNNTVRNRTPFFNWTAANDINSDEINYTINITSSVACDNLPIFENSTTQNYTSSVELCTRTDGGSGNRTYFWQVRACDAYNCSEWSEQFNFTVQPWVAISLDVDAIDFGGLNNLDVVDTTTNDPIPFKVINDGNVVADLVNISVNESLWDNPNAGLGTAYLQAKAANTSEEGAFNWSGSLTEWYNVPGSNSSIIDNLNYSDSVDSAEIEVKITVPQDEGAGEKRTWFIFSWEEAPEPQWNPT